MSGSAEKDGATDAQGLPKNSSLESRERSLSETFGPETGPEAARFSPPSIAEIKARQPQLEDTDEDESSHMESLESLRSMQSLTSRESFVSLQVQQGKKQNMTGSSLMGFKIKF
mmetsp:Transcript_16726/g.37613  ORF Transcript_16726/g.37613 Transcript_16726/m.37613 type:complete len:114 (-) Transcript_16726:355-696(-)